jgi:hypothetical protein
VEAAEGRDYCEHKVEKFLSIEGNSGSNIVLSENNQTWTGQNVIAGPPLTTNQEWIHDWSISFTEPGYSMTDLLQFSDTIVEDIAACHLLDPGFNRAFEKFASSFAISDAEDEVACVRAREELRFESNHPFDTEVCERWEIMY